ncbi:hypothetical protein POM88_011260 [Heracleum sosnowskyi]|uniref:Uncharacterized protein n=1 Tax=Heracleum sosnowskyi TaxID=360622 RepID=A0AAD8IVY6_9APIA|nr:hypothetical protein POM88_011260 [Heracleum sosnowskyi]
MLSLHFMEGDKVTVNESCSVLILGSIVKRITQSQNANKENRYEASQISHNYTKGRYAPFMSNNNKNDVNSSISDIAVRVGCGVGCTSIRPPFSVLTTRQPFSNISNQVNEIAGDAVFKSPDLSCVTTRIPLSNISNSRLNLNEKGCVDTMNENISATNENISDRNSPIDGIHHLFGGESKSKRSYVRGGHIRSTSMVKKKKCRRMDSSTLAKSSINLFGPDRDTNCQVGADVDYNIDVASGQTEFVEEDAEMFYDGELLYGSDSDKEDILSGDKSSLTKEGYSSLGPPIARCSKCDAIMWKEERVKKQVTKRTPEFGLCCGNGQIKLPKAHSTPSYLMQLYNDPEKYLKIVMRVCRAVSGRENFIGPSKEVGAIMVGDLEDTCGGRDIIIESKADGLERISYIHPRLMALRYPL